MATSFRRISALLTGLALAGTAFAGATVSAPRTAPDLKPVWSPDCIGYCQHPTNAGKLFRWGVASWKQEFIDPPLPSNWHTNHPGSVYVKNGMLTMEARGSTDLLTAVPDDQQAKYGRWEARMRVREFGTSGKSYRYFWELMPVEGSSDQYGQSGPVLPLQGDDHCGAGNVLIGSYTTGDAKAVQGVRVLPDQQFLRRTPLDLRSLAWHAFAVEITPDRISWFIDTKVVHTERRPAALTGLTYRPVFVMRGDPDAQMRPSYMQMDWVRYYTLDRPNAQSVQAPAMRQSTYSHAC